MVAYFSPLHARKFVNLRDKFMYVNMRLIYMYVNMQQIYIDMQHYNYVIMRDNYVNMRLELCWKPT